MGLMYATVIGYTVLLGLSAGFLMYFLTKTFDSSQATIIDPKPDTNY